jgi:hypothetical protein
MLPTQCASSHTRRPDLHCKPRTHGSLPPLLLPDLLVVLPQAFCLAAVRVVFRLWQSLQEKAWLPVIQGNAPALPQDPRVSHGGCPQFSPGGRTTLVHCRQGSSQNGSYVLLNRAAPRVIAALPCSDSLQISGQPFGTKGRAEQRASCFKNAATC